MALFVDASALTAVIAREPGFDLLTEKLGTAPALVTSAIAVWEASLVIARIKRVDVRVALSEVDRFAATIAMGIIPIADAEGAGAVDAHARYGRGTGHPAQLNMGDCFAYACARANNARLLYKGDDFSHTDLA